MNQLVSAGFFLLTFAAGLGLGLIMRGAAEPGLAYSPDLHVQQDGSTEQASGPEKSAEPTEQNYRPDQDTAPDNPPPAEVSRSRGGLSEIIAAFDAGEVARGDGVITGRVTDRDGLPMEGVVVNAGLLHAIQRARGWQRSDGPQPSPDIEKSVGELIRKLKRRAQARNEAITGADGRYRIEGLSEGTHGVGAYAEGYIFTHADRSTDSGVMPGTVVDFTARATGLIWIEVLMPDGSTPEHAKLLVKRRGSERYSSNFAWSADYPYIRPRPDEYTLRASAGEDDRYRSGEQKVYAGSGSKAGKITLQLIERNSVSGRVMALEAGYYKRLNLYAAPYDGDRKPDLDALQSTIYQALASIRDGYKYRFWDLKPGRYLVAVVRQQTIVAEATVKVGEGEIVQNFEVPGLKREDYVAVRIYGPEGRLLRKTFMNANCVSESGKWSRSYEGIRRSDGSYWIEHPRLKSGYDDGKGKYTVTVSNSETGSVRTVEYTRSANSEVEVHLEKVAHLSVTVSGYEKSELEGQITLVLQRDGKLKWRQVRDWRSDGNGTFRLGPVDPGSSTLKIYLKDNKYRNLVLATHALTTVAGENALTVALPRLNPLTISARLAAPGSEVTIQKVIEVDGKEIADGKGDLQLTAKLGDDFIAVFRHVPTGLCRIQMRHVNSEGVVVVETMNVLIPRQSRVDFVPD